MTERLDRIEATIERTSANVDDLLGAIATTDRQVKDLRGESADAQQRFKVLRAEAQNDRQETRQLWNDVVVQMERDRAANAAAVAALTEAIRAQSENIDRLERSVSQVVTESSAQRETINNLTALVNGRAS